MTTTDLARRASTAVAVPAATSRLRLILIVLSAAAFPLAYLFGLILNLTTT